MNDIHHQVGLSCASCHGGDPSNNDMEGAKGSDTGYVGAPGFKGISDLCGSCHSSAEFMRQYNPSLRIDQVSEYRTSVHGKLGAEGHTDVATCISCHSVHDIRKVNDPLSPTYPTKVADTCGSCHSDPKRMEAHGVPHNQVAEYRTSVHALALFEKRDLSAPTCNDCHGNHGAVPPQAASVAQVCGNCHGTQRSLFQQSPHGEMFTLMDLAGCVTCHGNHAVAAADESQLVGEDAVCSACHESDQGSEAADSMATQLVRLQERIGSAEAILERAEQAGMEVSRPIYHLHEAREKVIFARHEVHSLDLEKLGAIVAEGLEIGEDAHAEGVQAFKDLRFRRRGLYLSLAVIGFVIGALFLWIRETERE